MVKSFYLAFKVVPIIEDETRLRNCEQLLKAILKKDTRDFIRRLLLDLTVDTRWDNGKVGRFVS